MMHGRHERRGPEGFFFGVMLILIGTVFLLDRLGVLELGAAWQWWPLIPIALGLARIAGWRSAHGVASGLSLVLFGLWFLVSEFEWYGLHWSNSWPLVLVAIGLGLIVRPLLERLFDRQAGPDAPSGGEPHA